MTASEPTRASCLTPPAAGGVAVIQVTGPRAPGIVGPFLRSKNPIDLTRLPPDELRLCRFVQGAEIIDDVLVTARQNSDAWIVDLNLHGGPRIVQRVLMALRDAGAVITPPDEARDQLWSVRDAIEEETLRCLLQARTRAVATWLLRAGDAMREAIARCEQQIAAGEVAKARDDLLAIRAAGEAARFVLRGARIVVTGRPNAGKSNLVNRLAEREQILVSPIPGTTRDFVEAPAAIDGVPVLLVDTAGLRSAADPLEREAIARARLQLETADLILHVIDASSPSAPEDTILPVAQGSSARVLRVWNKIDRPIDPGQATRMAADDLRVSALTGAGLAELRTGVLEALGLSGWTHRVPAAWTDRQADLFSKAASQLAARPPRIEPALSALQNLLHRSESDGDAFSSTRV